jgi:flavin reductase (DIM6/NTAB) family NADH-FMN oxidoreductase RutF
MKQIVIVGAGQSGLQLALGLQRAGYAVTLVSDRTAGEIRAGRVTSSQCMFDWALQTERELNVNIWEQECPPVEGIALGVAGRHGEKQIDWAARLDHYAQAVDQRVKMPEWMQQTFDRYWSGYARWVTEWTTLLLHPREHVLQILESAGRGFDDPRSLFPWFMEPAAAKAFLDQTAKTEAERFDRRDFRRALGQFATGVTVVCTRAKDGQPVGLTVNSFSSVSLEPPLVLWILGKHATAYSDFKQASHFAINVLAADQHHLSRQFSTPMAGRFAGVECLEAAGGCPLLKGATAHFVCRMVREFDGGDHVIFLGEVIDYKWQEGEPLIFHSGRDHVKTRHPDLPNE